MPRAKTQRTRRKAQAEPKSQAELSVVLRDVVREKKRRGIAVSASPGQKKLYAPSLSFEYGDRIVHPSFGIGVVQLIKRTKIQVAFPDKERVLVHAQ